MPTKYKDNQHPKVHISRLIHRNNKTKIQRKGIKKTSYKDFYVNSLSVSWFKLISLIILSYIAINCLFAYLYLLDEGGIANTRENSFIDAFFFSIQTLATIGYGVMSPQTLFTNIIVSVEAFTGLLGLALATGIIFSKISMPSPRILFSDKSLISHYKNHECFMFRLGNLRNSQIADPTIKAVLICDEKTKEGENRRAFYDLELIRNNVPILMPSWTVRHNITKTSPLFELTKEDLRNLNVEIIVSITGFDEVLSQTLHTHYSYIASEIMFNYNFVDIMSWDKNGILKVDYKSFHDVVAI